MYLRKVFACILLMILSLLIIVACTKSNPNNPGLCDSVTNKAFASDVNPIIQTFCNQAACHNPGSTNGPGQLTNYAEIFNARVTIRAQVEAGLMPQNITLTAAQKNTIICWIDSGAPNN